MSFPPGGAVVNAEGQPQNGDVPTWVGDHAEWLASTGLGTVELVTSNNGSVTVQGATGPDVDLAVANSPKINGITISGTPSSGQVPTATGATAATWQTPPADAVASVFARTGAVTAQSGDYTAAQVTGAATLASPTFTGTVTVPAAVAATAAPRLNQLSPVATITSGALPTVQLVTATAAQILTSRDVETHTPVTMNSLISTVATCKVELSPDNTTFSTLAIWTEPVGVALAGTIVDVAVRVPAGWFLRLTTAQAVLGVTTYY